VQSLTHLEPNIVADIEFMVGQAAGHFAEDGILSDERPSSLFVLP
jgi:hypothetical protein